MTGEARTDVRVVRLDPARDAEGLIRFLSTNPAGPGPSPAPNRSTRSRTPSSGATGAPGRRRPSPGSPEQRAQSTIVSFTGTLPRVAFEYGHTWWAFSTACSACSRPRRGM